MTTVDEVMAELRRLGRPDHLAGMAHFGIRARQAFGVKVPEMRALARRIGRDQALALALWKCGQHEARHVAIMVAEPDRMTDALLERWVKQVDSWDLCDGFCNELVRRTADPWGKVDQWCRREAEFVRRAGFALLATLAVHDKAAPDRRFLDALSLIAAAAQDDRNFVKKAVNWALRQIGKRNLHLNGAALGLATALAERPDRAARWIGHDARHELLSDKVRAKLADKAA
jgi:3-methyladenine DNA glycosylase AlkD